MKEKIDDEEYKSSLVDLIRIDLKRSEYINKLTTMALENYTHIDKSKFFPTKRKIVYHLNSKEEEFLKRGNN
jgi:hypothetical protein